MRSRPLPRSHMKMPIGFKLWFAFVGTVMLAIFATMGVLAYHIATEPEATGNFIGRIIGGAVNGAQGKP